MEPQSSLEVLGRAVARAQDSQREQTESQRGGDCERFLGDAEQQSAHRARYKKALLAALACLGVAIGVWSLWRPAAPELVISGVKVNHDNGAWLSAVEQPLLLAFSDESRVELDVQTRARIGRVGTSQTRLTVELGRVRAQLEQRRSHEWRFDAGPFVVKGQATAFELEWRPGEQRFEITLSDGQVTVEGPILGESKSVEAGHKLRVSVQQSLAVLSSVATPAE